jgi:hypothetical protein
MITTGTQPCRMASSARGDQPSPVRRGERGVEIIAT